MEIFICGIIKESLTNPSILDKLAEYLKKTRIEERQNENPPKWHVNEYHLPLKKLTALTPILEAHIKQEWYIHAFNLKLGKLIVIFKNKSFEISANKDKSWNSMIEYGKSVGCGPEWTENIPLRV